VRPPFTGTTSDLALGAGIWTRATVQNDSTAGRFLTAGPRVTFSVRQTVIVVQADVRIVYLLSLPFQLAV